MKKIMTAALALSAAVAIVISVMALTSWSVKVPSGEEFTIPKTYVGLVVNHSVGDWVMIIEAPTSVAPGNPPWLNISVFRLGDKVKVIYRTVPWVFAFVYFNDGELIYPTQRLLGSDTGVAQVTSISKSQALLQTYLWRPESSNHVPWVVPKDYDSNQSTKIKVSFRYWLIEELDDTQVKKEFPADFIMHISPSNGTNKEGNVTARVVILLAGYWAITILEEGDQGVINITRYGTAQAANPENYKDALRALMNDGEEQKISINDFQIISRQDHVTYTARFTLPPNSTAILFECNLPDYGTAKTILPLA